MDLVLGNLVDVNAINSTYVGWNWKAGTTVTNNDGTLEAEVSANPDAGFSVVKTQSGSSGTQTIGHGLEVVPEVIFMKTTDKAGEWSTWEGVSGNPATSYGYLNLNDAFNTDSQQWSTTGDVVPNSSVFNINTGYTFGAGSLGDPFVAYCFASKEGYSKIGAYTGNGSADGTFIYTGFRPAFVMVKGLDLNSNWYIYDATRGTTNVELPFLNPNNSDAEQYFGAYDFVSNGFKNRETNQYFNQSNEKYLYMAFAEQPFKNANAR